MGRGARLGAHPEHDEVCTSFAKQLQDSPVAGQEAVVGIHELNVLATRPADTRVACHGEPRSILAHKANTRVPSCRRVGDEGKRTGLASVIYHDHLPFLSGKGERHDAFQAGPKQVRRLIVIGDNE